MKTVSTSNHNTENAIPLRPSTPVDAGISKGRPKGEDDGIEPGSAPKRKAGGERETPRA